MYGCTAYWGDFSHDGAGATGDRILGEKDPAGLQDHSLFAAVLPGDGVAVAVAAIRRMVIFSIAVDCWSCAGVCIRLSTFSSDRRSGCVLLLYKKLIREAKK